MIRDCILSYISESDQFYIENGNDKIKEDPSFPNFWNEYAFNERLAIGNEIVGVGTQSYGLIKGDIEILDKQNDYINYEKYDHIVEGDINLSSGELRILNCPDNSIEATLTVDPGEYRIRIYSFNLSSVKETDLVHSDDNDYYHIEVWQSNHKGRKVLKQYNPL